MKKGIKILGVLLLVFAVFFTMSIRDADATTCYKLYYSWDWSEWYLGYIYLYNDWTFEYADDDGYYWTGWWYKYGTTYALDWDEGCYAFYSGTLAKGYMKCADGSGIGYDPGIYQLKKTKCPTIYYKLEKSKNAHTNGSDKKGPSPNNPH